MHRLIFAILVATVFTCAPHWSNAQITEERLMELMQPADPAIGTASIGLFRGGGSLVGADLEVMASDHIGIQVGAGLFGFGGGINFHPRSGYRTSCISLGYFHQGFKEFFTQSLIGPTYIFRGKKWFTAQIGMGYQLKEGPGAANLDPDALPSFQLLYSIGGYFPLY